MSWTDRGSVETIKRIRDQFKVKTFVETGTFKGINAQIQSKNFEEVETYESIHAYWYEATDRFMKLELNNVRSFYCDSVRGLKLFIRDYKKLKRKDTIIFYLDAHFYNPKGPRWQVKRELRALRGFKNAIIIIHDFDNGLGHCIYDGERLGMNVLGKLLNKVNPNFHYYTNRIEDCDIMHPEETEDLTMKDNLVYAWSKPRLTYRGLLYCVPKKLKLELRKI